MKEVKFPIVAQRFRTALANANMTAQELSTRTGVLKSSISHYVNGSHCPTNKTAFILAQALDVNPAWLMGFDVPEEDVPYTIKNEDELLIDRLLSNHKTREVLLAFVHSLSKML